MDEVMIALERATEKLAAGDFVAAHHLAADAVAWHPDHGRLWWIAGVAAHRLANYDDARQAFEQAALLVPLDGETQCALAECYLQTGRTKQARELFKLLAADELSAIDLLPRVAAGLGQVGDLQGALDVCRDAAERAPDEAAPRFGMAYYLRRLGYPAAAIVPVMSRAFELEPDNPAYRASLAFLLVEAGRQDEAYDLLREVSLTQMSCPCCLRRMMTLFRSTGDHARWRDCSARLHEVARDE
jgi:Flp pilus assembly protein TadD